MPPRKKAVQAMLGEAPSVPKEAPRERRVGTPGLQEAPKEAPPKFLEYKSPTDGQVWQVEKFDLLAVLADQRDAGPKSWPAWMAELHAFAEPDTQRWYFLRRLFGIVPLIPPDGTTTEDLRCLDRAELAALSGITVAQLGEELEHWKLNWVKNATAKDYGTTGLRTDQAAASAREAAAGQAGQAGQADGMLALGDELLRRFDFDKSNFEVEIYAYDDVTKSNSYRPRPAEKTRKELEWFIGRLMRPEWQQMLEDPTDGSLARSALMNELYLHRFDAEMMMLMPNTPKWKTMAGDRQKIEEQFQSQLTQLKNDFPELGVAGRVTMHAIVSDMNLAHRQYYGHGENKLWDGVHTAAEIVFMNRTSAQLPVPRYRLSWQIMVAEARHGLYDPNFRSMLKKSDLKKLDRGYQRGVEEARLEDGEKLVDLERGVIPGEPGCDEFTDLLATDKHR